MLARRLLITSLFLSFLCISGCAEKKERLPGGNPTKDRSLHLRGYVHHYDAAVRHRSSEDKDQFHWAQRALSGYQRALVTDVPVEIGGLPDAYCKFPKPENGQAVHHVHVGGGTQLLPIYTVDQLDIDQRANKLQTSDNADDPAALDFSNEDQMSLVNVIVTRSDTPVYLVLSSEKKVVWNIQKNNHARIETIAIIAGDGVGLTNAPRAAKVHALYGKERSDCGVDPVRKPQPHWGFSQNVNETGGGATVLAENHADADAYNDWFEDQFGISSHRDVTGALGVSNVLVGTPPGSLDSRAPYKSLAGAKLLVSDHDYVFAAGPGEYYSTHLELVREAAVTQRDQQQAEIAGSASSVLRR